jgi:excisionase family DNA binding protein
MQDYVLISIPETRIKALIEQAVQNALNAQPAPRRDNAPDKEAATFVTKLEAARLISVCPSTIDNAARDGRLKRHYVGKSVRFEREQVLQLAKPNSNHKLLKSTSK